MKVLYTCDNNYVWLMSISMLSLFKTNQNANEITVYLIGENISDDNKKVLEDIANEYKRKCIVIDLPDIKMSPNLFTDRWPKSAFTRLFCGQILPEDVKKIIYIDCDTIIKSSLVELYEDEKMSQFPVSGVKDCVSGLYKENIGLNKNSTYINAGILFINVELLRQIDMFKEIEDFTTNYNKKINYADQDVLNYVLKNKLGVLNPKYNVMTLEFAYPYKDILKIRRPNNYYEENEIKNAVENPAIIHYTTNMTTIRPWFSNANHPRKDDFLNIYKENTYIKKELQAYSTNTAKYKFLNFLLHLPKSIGYSCIGIIHSELVPLLKRIKK